MAIKKIAKILSGGAIIFCIVVLCALVANVRAFEALPVTYTISGSVTCSDGSGGLSGVTIKGLPNDPVTGSDGTYTASVQYGWAGKAIPQKDGYTFEPPSKSYSRITGNMSGEDYVATVKTFTISGNVEGLGGVVLNGLPSNPVTGTNGTYSVMVPYGWSGTVIPEKEGYSFTPANKPYDSVVRDMTNQNYKPAIITFTISGSVGVEGVVMNGLPGNPASLKNGTYSAQVQYGFSGKVTPKKEGYTFDPSERQYTELKIVQTNEDYTATVMTYTISGNAGIDGVVMSGLPGSPVADASGNYTATVDYGFVGTVTPTKEGYSFVPASKIYSKVTTDKSDENYTAAVKMLTIAGSTAMEGVVLNGLPGNPVTGSNGAYKVTVEYGWNGTVMPEKEGYTFTPDSKQYDYITADQMNQNYTPAQITYTISGSVGEEGIVMNGLPGNPVSDKTGLYRATVKYGFSGTVTPSKEGYSFDPAFRKYDNLVNDLANEDYTATLSKYTIAGTIISDRGPVGDVFVVADAGGGSGTTDASGRYELIVNYGWKGTVTPTKEGYTFTPANKKYTSVTKDQTNEGYSAKVLTFNISGSVIIGGTAIEGVLVTASEGGGSATTDSKGKYTIAVPYGWSGEVTPTKEGFNFNPPSQTYTNVTQNYRDGAPEMIGRRPTLPTTAPAEAPRFVPVGPGPTVPSAEPRVPPAEPRVPPAAEPRVPPAERPAEVAAVPKTPLETQIDVIQKQLADLLSQAAAPRGPTVEAVPEAVLITNTFVDSDLPTEVLPSIATQAGIPIIPDETVVGKITCDLRAVPLEKALEIVLAGTPYVVKKTPYYYVVCSAKIEDAMFPMVSETRRIKLNYATADSAVALLSTAFKPYAQGETGTHTVTVTAPPALMNRIVADLEDLDVPPRNVLLDASIVVMERGDLLNLGVEWGWPTISAGLFGNDLKGAVVGGAMTDFAGKWPWGVSIGYTPDATFTNSLQMTLNLLAENGEATILSKPQVLAQDGKQSQIQVLTEEYYMMTPPEMVAGGYFGYSRAELQEITSGTTLTITPRISDNNDITLTVAVEVSNSIPRGRGSELPVVTRRTASNVVRIKDGGTVALAGLTENRTQMKYKRVPGISRVPLVGSLFRHSESDESTREIAVFVTAHLVSESGQAVSFGGPSAGIQAPAPTLPQLGGERGGDQGFKMSLRESLSRF